MRLPGATHRNVYVSSEAAAKRVLESIRRWVEQHLRLQVNADKSGAGRPWERKFLGFRINRKQQIEAAPESVEGFKTKVRGDLAQLPQRDQRRAARRVAAVGQSAGGAITG